MEIASTCPPQKEAFPFVLCDSTSSASSPQYGFNGGLLCLLNEYTYRSSPNRLFEVPPDATCTVGKALITQFSGGKKIPLCLVASDYWA